MFVRELRQPGQRAGLRHFGLEDGAAVNPGLEERAKAA